MGADSPSLAWNALESEGAERAGVVMAGAALGWFISRQYQIDPKKAGLGVAIYIAFVVAFNVLFSSVA